MSESRGSKGGVSLTTVLVAVFFVLKVTGNIAWSWWWVFSPWLILGGLTVVIGVLLGIVAGLTGR